INLAGNPTFDEVLARVRKVCLEALSHQEVPFEKIVEKLRPNRTPNQHPLFQVSFTFLKKSAVQLQLCEVSAEEVEINTGLARLDIHLVIEEENGRLKGHIDYNSVLFDATTIERMVGHFQTLLESIVANPDQRISDLPMLTGPEKHQLLVEWNDTRKDYHRDK